MILNFFFRLWRAIAYIFEATQQQTERREQHSEMSKENTMGVFSHFHSIYLSYLYRQHPLPMKCKARYSFPDCSFKQHWNAVRVRLSLFLLVKERTREPDGGVEKLRRIFSSSTTFTQRVSFWLELTTAYTLLLSGKLVVFICRQFSCHVEEDESSTANFFLFHWLFVTEATLIDDANWKVINKVVIGLTDFKNVHISHYMNSRLLFDDGIETKKSLKLFS